MRTALCGQKFSPSAAARPDSDANRPCQRSGPARPRRAFIHKALSLTPIGLRTRARDADQKKVCARTRATADKYTHAGDTLINEPRSEQGGRQPSAPHGRVRGPRARRTPARRRRATPAADDDERARSRPKSRRAPPTTRTRRKPAVKDDDDYGAPPSDDEDEEESDDDDDDDHYDFDEWRNNPYGNKPKKAKKSKKLSDEEKARRKEERDKKRGEETRGAKRKGQVGAEPPVATRGPRGEEHAGQLRGQVVVSAFRRG